MSNPSFTYTPNVPQAAQKISATQEPILNNFQSINDFFIQNHVGFLDPINYGKHTFTSLPFQSTDPDTLNGEMAVYSKATPSGPNTAEIFYRYPDNGTIMQLTGGTGGGFIASTPGFSYLSSSIVMMWGKSTIIATQGVNNLITFPTGGGFPTFTVPPYSIVFSSAVNYTYNVGSGQPNGPYILGLNSSNPPTTANFTLHNRGGFGFSTSIYWYAIGSYA